MRFALLSLAARNLRRHLSRTLFSLGAIVAGVVGLSLAGGFIEDVYHQLAERTIHAQLGHLQLLPSAAREAGDARPEASLVSVPPALERELSGQAQVRRWMKRVRWSALLAVDGVDFAVDLEGVEPEAESALGTHLKLIAGRPLHQPGKSPGIVVGEGVARRLGLRPGDFVQLAASTTDGAMNLLELEVLGVFRSFSKEFDERTVRVALPQAQELLQTDKVSLLVIELDRTEATERVAAALRTAAQRAGLEVRPWHELSEFYGAVRSMYERQFGLLRWVALVLVLMSVFNSLNMTVHERIAEFGTMRALGDPARQVVGLILAEALLLGLVGAVVGLALSAGLASLISAVGIPMPPPPNAEEGYLAQIRLTVEVGVSAALVGWGAAVVAGLRPATAVARLPIVDSLRTAV